MTIDDAWLAERERIPTRKAWQLVARNPAAGDCHGHIFKTEREASEWVAQTYVAGRYTYQEVDVVKCTSCGLWHIPLNGLMAWSCATCEGPGPRDEIDRLARENAALLAVKNAAESLSKAVERVAEFYIDLEDAPEGAVPAWDLLASKLDAFQATLRRVEP